MESGIESNWGQWSHFCIFPHDLHKSVHRRCGVRKKIHFWLERETAFILKVMVWGALWYGLYNVLKLVSLQQTDKRIFQWDNARPLTSAVTAKFICVYQVTVLSWPARSRDRSAIEQIRDMIGRGFGRKFSGNLFASPNT